MIWVSSLLEISKQDLISKTVFENQKQIKRRTPVSTVRMTWAASTLLLEIFWEKEPLEQPKSGKNRKVLKAL